MMLFMKVLKDMDDKDIYFSPADNIVDAKLVHLPDGRSFLVDINATEDDVRAGRYGGDHG